MVVVVVVVVRTTLRSRDDVNDSLERDDVEDSPAVVLVTVLTVRPERLGHLGEPCVDA